MVISDLEQLANQRDKTKQQNDYVCLYSVIMHNCQTCLLYTSDAADE